MSLSSLIMVGSETASTSSLLRDDGYDVLVQLLSLHTAMVKLEVVTVLHDESAPIAAAVAVLILSM